MVHIEGQHTAIKYKTFHTFLIIFWLAADRSAESANEFRLDVASRLSNRVQLTTDGQKPYLMAVDNAFGNDIDIDFAQLIKIYGAASGGAITALLILQA